jgi:ArsR family transcriptional regulator
MNAAPLNDMKAASAKAANLMRALGHEGRLLVMCALCEREYSAGELVTVTGLSQSALSQHLAKLRADGFVATRRESPMIFYRLAAPAVRSVVEVLHQTYCPNPNVETRPCKAS